MFTTAIKQLLSKDAINKMIMIAFIERAVRILITLVDSYFVQGVNSSFLGLINTGDNLFGVLCFLLDMCSSPVTILVATAVGAKRLDDAAKAVKSSYMMGIIMSVIVITIMCGVSCAINIVYPKFTADEAKYAAEYLKVSALHVLPYFLFTCTSGILHTLGYNKYNLWLWLLTNSVNTVVDIILFRVFSVGIWGAAVSTTALHL